MTTSAERLNFILSTISRSNANNEPFLTIAANHLGLEGEDREIVTLAKLNELVKQMKAEIEQLDFDDSQIDILRRYASAFNGLANFSHVGLNMQAARNNFLKAEHLVGLTNIHFALSNKFSEDSLPSDLNQLCADIKSLKADIAQSTLPNDLKRAISKRLDHIHAILENVNFFGTQDLKGELDALVGSIVVSKESRNKKNAQLIALITAICATGYGVLAKTDKALDHIEAIREKIPMLSDFMGSEPDRSD